MKIHRVVPPWHSPLSATHGLCISLFFVGFAFYLVWLIQNVLNFDYGLGAYGLLFAEAGITLSALGGALVHWKYRSRILMPPPEGASVDVLIPTLNESLDVLRMTVRACVAMDYPHKVYVLDDGNRESVRKLAKDLEVEYIARESREGAKAGNLNYALERTTGEFIAVFDADGIPRREFLTTLMGYFRDPKVAVAQSNQTYYNLDSFQHSPKFHKTQMWNEQSLYYDIILCGRDAVGASAWTGNGSLLRRSALQAIGGVPTGTLTEDLHATLLLYEKDYKVIYHPVPLAYGLAPRDFDSFIKQRNRWQVGFIQALKKEWRIYFFSKHLKLAQRLSLLEPVIYYGESIPRIVGFFLPLLLALGLGRSIEGGYLFLVAYIGMWVWRSYAYYWASRGRGINSLLEGYWYLKMWTYGKNFLLFPWIKDRQFFVTPKDPDPQNRGHWMGRLGLLYTYGVMAWVIGLIYLHGFSVGLSLALLLAVYNWRIVVDANYLLKKEPLVKGAYGLFARFTGVTIDSSGVQSQFMTRLVSDKELWVVCGELEGDSVKIKLNAPGWQGEPEAEVAYGRKIMQEPPLYEYHCRFKEPLVMAARDSLLYWVFEGQGEPLTDVLKQERYWLKSADMESLSEISSSHSLVDQAFSWLAPGRMRPAD